MQEKAEDLRVSWPAMAYTSDEQICGCGDELESDALTQHVKHLIGWRAPTHTVTPNATSSTTTTSLTGGRSLAGTGAATGSGSSTRIGTGRSGDGRPFGAHGAGAGANADGRIIDLDFVCAFF